MPVLSCSMQMSLLTLTDGVSHSCFYDDISFVVTDLAHHPLTRSTVVLSAQLFCLPKLLGTNICFSTLLTSS